MAILTTNRDPSKRFTHRDAAILRDPERCDDWRTYRECGWFCVIGYKGTRRVVHAHCEDRETFDRIMYPEKGWERYLCLTGRQRFPEERKERRSYDKARRKAEKGV